jgi:hypothetical protein
MTRVSSLLKFVLCKYAQVLGIFIWCFILFISCLSVVDLSSALRICSISALRLLTMWSPILWSTFLGTLCQRQTRLCSNSLFLRFLCWRLTHWWPLRLMITISLWSSSLILSLILQIDVTYLLSLLNKLAFREDRVDCILGFLFLQRFLLEVLKGLMKWLMVSTTLDVCQKLFIDCESSYCL